MEKFKSKTTLILGASTKPNRYSNIAAHRLTAAGHKIIMVAKRNGMLLGQEIYDHPVAIDNLDTITLYLNAANQVEYYDYIINLQPKRVIFNPGTENQELYTLLKKNKIDYTEACTLVLLSIDKY